MVSARRRGRGGRSRGVTTSAAAAPGPSPSWVSTRFTLTFLLLIAIFAMLTATAAADRVIHQPLSRFTVLLAAPLLHIFGTVSRSGSFVTFNGFSASIEEACDGVLPAYIYLSAVLAFPSRLEQKLWGILLGMPAIFTMNLARVITLVMVGAYWPDLFERVHIYVWQALVIALSMAVWVFWAEGVVRPGVAPGR